MSKVYFSLGSNLGDRKGTLLHALDLMDERIGSRMGLSAFYETEPWGFESENIFLNAAVGYETELTPRELLRVTQEIECASGRKEKSHHGVYADRPVDIDLLLYDDLVLREEDLELPHPLMHKRDFVLRPLAEIAPLLVHPVLKKDMQTLLRELEGA
jgi:2-amino-4-hydroxy-6-hydroxymethyldihydropteridine diphosphokinase